MTEDAKKTLALVKRKLGREKYRDLAAHVLERKVARANPKKVKEEIKTKFGIDIGREVIFVKH